MKTLAILLGICMIIFACKDDEPGVEVFTVEIIDGYLPQPADNWIIVSNSSGELLDYQLLQPGIFTLQAVELPSDNLLNISLLNRGTSNPNINFFSMTTYTGIPAGETWVLAPLPEIDSDPNPGEANVQITNLPPIETLNVTFSKLWEGRFNTQGTVIDNGTTSEGSFVLPLSEAQTDILISVNPQYLDESIPPDFESKYYWLSDLTDGQQINLEFPTDFFSYDQQFEIEVPDANTQVLLDVYGFEDLDATYGTGFVFTSSLAIYPINKIGAFFNDGFNHYETVMTVNNNNGSYTYKKVGDPPAPEDLNARSLDFQIQNSSFNSFAFSASPEFQIVESGWVNQVDNNGVLNTLSWTVFSERSMVNYPVLVNFPEELVQDNPALDTDNLDNTFNRFIYNIDNRTYEDFVDKSIVEPRVHKQLEEVYQLSKFD